MGLFTKKIGTVFLKETSDTDTFLERMEELIGKDEGELKQEKKRKRTFRKNS